MILDLLAHWLNQIIHLKAFYKQPRYMLFFVNLFIIDYYLFMILKYGIIYQMCIM